MSRSRLSRYGSRGFAVCGHAAWNFMPVGPYPGPLSAAISKLNCLAGRMALFHHSTFVIALLQEWANINYLTYLLQLSLNPKCTKRLSRLTVKGM